SATDPRAGSHEQAGGARAPGMAATGGDLPPGHPPIAGAGAGTGGGLPAGHPPVTGDERVGGGMMPAGHPPVTGMEPMPGSAQATEPVTGPVAAGGLTL